MKNTLDRFFLLGLFFLFLQVLIFYSIIKIGNYELFLWFCDHSPLLFAIAFFMRNINIIKALINIGFLGQFLWLIDFLAKTIFDVYLFGITDYIFTGEIGLLNLIPILAHILSTFLALLFTFREKTKKNVLFISVIYLFALFILTLIFTSSVNNINCIYQVCVYNNLTFAFYTYFWPLIVFLVVIFPTYLIQRALSYKFAK